ncbi:hypothetical protein AsAng_0034420 [Aureispira anguillae]|uniref:Uncharacterized protein n=1 Tax=Aureispira anguillae TaxID=2864201 RepID=A0A916DUI1_9BACT|nr:hypothetical protein AsAng_0034420 [Aureispira anguillae]
MLETCWKKGGFVGNRKGLCKNSILDISLVFQQNDPFFQQNSPFFQQKNTCWKT